MDIAKGRLVTRRWSLSMMRCFQHYRKEAMMETKDENKVEIKAHEPKEEEATEKRAMKIRLKTGVMAGGINLHL